jgi:hypothetical protein
LRRLHRQATQAWPDVELGIEAWIDHVAPRVAPTDLSAVLTDDLYLAAACARGDATAIRSFERAYFCARLGSKRPISNRSCARSCSWPPRAARPESPNTPVAVRFAYGCASP